MEHTEQQLILFHDDPMKQLQFELDNVKKRLGNLQRGLFARHSELAKKYMETAYELEMLKSSLCHNKISVESYNNQRVDKKIMHFDFAS